jgi:hypothetical protein
MMAPPSIHSHLDVARETVLADARPSQRTPRQAEPRSMQFHALKSGGHNWKGGAAHFERSRDVVQTCTYLWDASPHARYVHLPLGPEPTRTSVICVTCSAMKPAAVGIWQSDCTTRTRGCWPPSTTIASP